VALGDSQALRTGEGGMEAPAAGGAEPQRSWLLGGGTPESAPPSLPLSAPDSEQQLLQSFLPFLETGVRRIPTSSQPGRAPPPPLHVAGRC